VIIWLSNDGLLLLKILEGQLRMLFHVGSELIRVKIVINYLFDREFAFVIE
jgi:hypothetical protein